MAKSHVYTWTPWTVDGDRLIMADKTEWDAPLAWDTLTGDGKPLVFVDVDPFDDPVVKDELRRKMFHVIDSCSDLTFVLKSRRVELIRDLWEPSCSVPCECSCHNLGGMSCCLCNEGCWTRLNVYLFFSAFNQGSMEWGIEHLLECRDLVSLVGLDLTALAGPIDLTIRREDWRQRKELIGWVRVGGETGPGAVPCDLEWIAKIVEQCAAASVPCEVTGLGSQSIVGAKKVCDLTWSHFPSLRGRGRGMGFEIELKHPDGADPAEWPKELQVQQTPEVDHE